MKNIALALLMLVVGACCSADRSATPERRNEVVTEPHSQVPSGHDQTAHESIGPEFDCDVPPQGHCCTAGHGECIACTDEASQAQRDAWDAECRPVMAPLPDHFDCAQPAPLTPCCRAMLPKCLQCAERNRAVDAAYRAQCDTPK